MSSVQILSSPPAHNSSQLRCGWTGQGRRVLLWHLVWEALLCLLGLGVDHRPPFKLLFYLLGLRTPHTPQHLRKSQIAAK